MKYGPGRGELKFRLAVSLAGLGLTGAALLASDSLSAPAIVEVLGIAGLFFGGTALWAARRLMTREPEE
jgi:xanthosine utilization system XapX-like protein